MPDFIQKEVSTKHKVKVIVCSVCNHRITQSSWGGWGYGTAKCNCGEVWAGEMEAAGNLNLDTLKKYSSEEEASHAGLIPVSKEEVVIPDFIQKIVLIEQEVVVCSVCNSEIKQVSANSFGKGTARCTCGEVWAGKVTMVGGSLIRDTMKRYPSEKEANEASVAIQMKSK